MLSFAEEMMLLLLDDQDGSFLPIPEWSMQCALAGAVLMDLALADRIDTDVDSLMLVDEKPTGDPLLDPTLERIAASGEVHGARYWVENTAAYADE
ncbi:MAG: GPP34 family phosphoprotein, partial [Alphaproteobacteria bacterium]|nr:GPP34 family phosphoprotein [Alphaproteobacteria bacterium]